MGEITGGAMRRLSLGAGAAGGGATAAITAGEAAGVAGGGAGGAGKEMEGVEGASQELMSARVRLTGEREEVQKAKALLEVRGGAEGECL